MKILSFLSVDKKYVYVNIELGEITEECLSVTFEHLQHILKIPWLYW